MVAAKTKAKTKEKPKKPAAKKTTAETKIIHFLLDETGSMQMKKEEAVSGFNKFIKEFDPSGAKVLFSLTKFDSQAIKPVHELVPIEKVPEMTPDDFQPGAMTPLLDATAFAIKKATDDAKEKKATSVLIITLTDGLENASREVTRDVLNARIKEKESEGWTFIYLGVSAEAWSGGEVLYQGTQSAQNLMKTSGKQSVASSYRGVTVAASSWAAGPSGETANVGDKLKQHETKE